MSRPPDVRLEMVSDPTYLGRARELVASVARRLGFNEEACGQIALAVDEALCNIIRHGYGRRKDGPIWLSLWPLGQSEGGPGVRIVIEDEARQIDPEAIKGRDLDEIRPGGLGVHIIRQVMDEARYERRDGAGMRLTLVKRTDARADAPGGVRCLIEDEAGRPAHAGGQGGAEGGTGAPDAGPGGGCA